MEKANKIPSNRSLLNQMVRNFANENGYKYHIVWYKLYVEYLGSYTKYNKINRDSRGKMLDWAEKNGHLDDLIALAEKKFDRGIM